MSAVSAKGASSNQPGATPQVTNRKTKLGLKARAKFPEHGIAAPNKYLSNAMNRAVGARERLGGVTIPGAMPQADIKRAFGPTVTVRPQSLGTGAPGTSLSPAFNHTRPRLRL